MPSKWGSRYESMSNTLPINSTAFKVGSMPNSLINNLGVFQVRQIVATPLWAKCEDETHTPKSGNLESSGTPKNSELDCRGQNTLHWGVFNTNGKVLKCRCPKWPRMNHLDICSLSYGQKKGRESNW